MKLLFLKWGWLSVQEGKPRWNKTEKYLRLINSSIWGCSKSFPCILINRNTCTLMPHESHPCHHGSWGKQRGEHVGTSSALALVLKRAQHAVSLLHTASLWNESASPAHCKQKWQGAGRQQAACFRNKRERGKGRESGAKFPVSAYLVLHKPLKVNHFPCSLFQQVRISGKVTRRSSWGQTLETGSCTTIGHVN